MSNHRYFVAASIYQVFTMLERLGCISGDLYNWNELNQWYEYT